MGNFIDDRDGFVNNSQCFHDSEPRAVALEVGGTSKASLWVFYSRAILNRSVYNTRAPFPQLPFCLFRNPFSIVRNAIFLPSLLWRTNENTISLQSPFVVRILGSHLDPESAIAAAFIDGQDTGESGAICAGGAGFLLHRALTTLPQRGPAGSICEGPVSSRCHL